MSELGLLQVYTGSGKGKTTAALGLTLRAWGRGLRVCIIQFMKVGEDYGEIIAVRKLPGVDLFQFGREALFYKGEHTPEDVRLAREGLGKLTEVLTDGHYDIVIVDEINVVVNFGLLTVEEVLKVIRSRRNGVEVVLTGRNAPVEFIEEADLVTERVGVKHPYDSGVMARPGVEY
jgi:cob(I)alamin adenosyltransferase